MKRIMVTAFIMIFVAATLLGQENPLRPMTTDDVLNIVRVGNGLISPDGNRVFFSKTELDWSKNKSNTKYYMAPAGGGEAFQYIGKEGGSSFQFSPDGSYFSFKRTVDKKSQIFIMATSGGEGVQLTKHKGSVGRYKWSFDASQIFFTANEFRSEEAEKEHKLGADMIYVDEGPNGQAAGNWSNIWVFDIKSKKEKKITDEKFLVGDFDPSPDSKRIIFTAKYTNRRNDGDKSEIYIINVSDKLKTRLTNNQAPESGLAWAPDGSKFAYTAADDKQWLNRNSKIWIMNPNSKEYRKVSGKFEGSFRSIIWTPDSRYILFSGQQRSNGNLYKLDIETGDYRQLTNIEGRLSASSFTKDRKKMVYSFSDFDSPSDLYVSDVDNFSPIRITDANPWINEEIFTVDT